MMLNSRQEVLQALRIAAKGQERLNILNLKHNRDFIKNSGANVTLVSGKISSGKTTKQQMQNLNLGLIARLNAKTGMPDGIGAMGGLAERTSSEEFSRLHQDERRRLVGLRDDIVLQNDSPVLINDINLIRINNVLRETREELENLGITDFKLPAEKIKLINMPDIRDDNYAVNIWNGKGDVWAVTPYCHVLQCSAETLQILAQQSQDIKRHQEHSEAAEFRVVPLWTALKSYGNHSGKNRLEDGRNAQTDYRYPHEWLAAWYIASAALNHDDNAVLSLMNELQQETAWKISLDNAAQKMGKDLNFIADVLQLKPETVQKMEQTSLQILSGMNMTR